MVIKIFPIFGSENKNDINAFFSKFENKIDIFIDGHFLDNKNKDFPSLLIIHELIHVILRESSKISIVNDFTLKNKKQIEGIISKNKLSIPREIFFEELFISLFAPEGYFKEKYYNKKIALPKVKQNGILRLKDLRKLKAYELKGVLSYYISQNKSLDTNLLNIIIKSE